jgi:hypothetical protein
MAAQSLLLKLGARLQILGSAAALAFAFPIADGNGDVTAATASNRIGFYATQATTSSKIGVVVNGTEVLSVGASVITAQVPVGTPASTTTAAGLNIGQGSTPTSPNNGDIWITSAGMYAQVNGGTVGPFGTGGGGVTSVGLALPAIFTVTGSPVTASGTLTGTLATQTANYVWAGPTTGAAAAPTFRALVAADLPSSVITGSGTSGELVYWNGTETVTGSSTLRYTTGAGVTCNQPNTTATETWGANAGNTTMTGANNTLLGNGPGAALTSGGSNVMIGVSAGAAITGTSGSTLVGYHAGGAYAGGPNTFIGSSAGYYNAGSQNVAVGLSALEGATGGGSSGSYNAAFGAGALTATTTGQYLVGMGYDAGESNTTGSYNIFLGALSGDSTAAGASNRLVAGSLSAPISTVFIGNGETAASPQAVVYNATGGSGANVAGASYTIAGGIGTGTGAGGAVIIKTAPVGTSSSTPNTLTTRWTVGGDGGTTWTGIATTSAPALSPSNSGTIYYDDTLQGFYASVNGGAYASLSGGGGNISGSCSGSYPSGAPLAVASATIANTIVFPLALSWGNGSALDSFFTVISPLAGYAWAWQSSDVYNQNFQRWSNTAGNTFGFGTPANGGADDGSFHFWASVSGTYTTWMTATPSVPSVTFSYEVLTPASTTTLAGLNIGQGSAPTTPVNGDVWITSAGMYARVNGATVGPFGAGGGVTGSGTSGEVTYWNGTSTVTGSTLFTFSATTGLHSNISGVATNEFFGSGAGSASVTGNHNTLVGNLAGAGIVGTSDNTIVGYNSGHASSGADNVFVGSQVAPTATSSAGNVCIGFQAGFSLTTSGDNTLIGLGSGYNMTGIGNTAIGYDSGNQTTTGTYNIFLGYGSGDSTAVGASNRFVAGGNSAAIGNVFIGNGETNAAPQAIIYNATGGSGANIAGASFTIAGGIGTGTGVGGNIIFRVASATTSSSTPNALTTLFTINQALYATFACAVAYPISTKTSNYTMLASDYTIMGDTSSSAFQITLMASPPTGLIVNVKMIGSGTYNLTIAPSAGTIDGSSTIVVSTVNVNYTMQYDGTEWRVL